MTRQGRPRWDGEYGQAEPKAGAPCIQYRYGGGQRGWKEPEPVRDVSGGASGKVKKKVMVFDGGQGFPSWLQI